MSSQFMKLLVMGSLISFSIGCSERNQGEQAAENQNKEGASSSVVQDSQQGSENLEKKAEELKGQAQQMGQKADELGQQARNLDQEVSSRPAQNVAPLAEDRRVAPSSQSVPRSVSFDELRRNQSATRKVQEALKSNGNDPGRIDGLWGPKTQQALNQFMLEKNMTANSSEIDAQTIQALGVDLSSDRMPASE